MSGVTTGAQPAVGPESTSPRVRPAPPRRARLLLHPAAFLAATGLVLVPFAIALARAIDRSWLPVGDNGFMYVRARDVFGGDPPLLYMSSLGCGFETPCNHPGPLLYYLMAGPTELFGRSGLAVATTLLNAAAVVAIVLVARRLGGPVLGAAALLVTATLAWTMGSELLFDPWSPNSLILPSLLFLLVVWSVANGDLALLPALVAVGTLVFQTSLSYALIVPLLGAAAVLGLVVDLRRLRRADPDAWPRARRRALRIAGASALLLLVLWVPPIVEQLMSEGPGNVTLIARESGNGGTPLGFDDAVPLLAAVLAVPRWWLRDSLSEAYSSPPSFGVALVALGVVAAVLALLGWLAHRRGDRTASVGIFTAAVAIVVGLLTAWRAPLDFFGRLSPYQTRVLWPLAAFVTLVAAGALLRHVTAPGDRRPLVVPALVVGALVMTWLNIPVYRAGFGTHEPAWAYRAVRDLDRQSAALRDRGTLFFDWDLGDSAAYQFVASGLMSELRRDDVPFVVDEPFLVRNFGERRRFTGDNADVVVTVRTGQRALEAPPGLERIALRLGLDAREGRELTDLRDRIRRYVEAGEFTLTEDAQRQLARLHAFQDEDEDEVEAEEAYDADQLLGRERALIVLLQQGFVVIEDDWGPRFGRYVELQQRWDERTAGVFVAPLRRRG
jgi:hypothetical protein